VNGPERLPTGSSSFIRNISIGCPGAAFTPPDCPKLEARCSNTGEIFPIHRRSGDKSSRVLLTPLLTQRYFWGQRVLYGYRIRGSKWRTSGVGSLLRSALSVRDPCQHLRPDRRCRSSLAAWRVRAYLRQPSRLSKSTCAVAAAGRSPVTLSSASPRTSPTCARPLSRKTAGTATFPNIRTGDYDVEGQSAGYATSLGGPATPSTFTCMRKAKLSLPARLR
jgi:hypothetical protein